MITEARGIRHTAHRVDISGHGIGPPSRLLSQPPRESCLSPRVAHRCGVLSKPCTPYGLLRLLGGRNEARPSDRSGVSPAPAAITSYDIDSLGSGMARQPLPTSSPVTRGPPFAVCCYREAPSHNVVISSDVTNGFGCSSRELSSGSLPRGRAWAARCRHPCLAHAVPASPKQPR